MGSLHDTTIIIPQFGRAELTAHAIRSYRRQHPSDGALIIVDDGSPMSALETLRAQAGCDFSLLRLPRTRGVTAAWNAGALQADTEFLVFLNNDTVTQGVWLDRLVAPLRTRSACMTGARWRWAAEVPSTIGIARLLQGWCFALRRETFLELGGFDERYRLYFSDADLQLRCLQRWPDSLRATPRLPLQHLGKETTRRLRSRFSQKAIDRARFLARWTERQP